MFHKKKKQKKSYHDQIIIINYYKTRLKIFPFYLYTIKND